MTNEELWRSAEDAIIPAPEAMIVVPVPVALPPEAEVEIGEVAAEVELGVAPAEVELREVAVEAAMDETPAAEAVVDELSVVRAVKEVEAEEVAAEEVVTDESSGLWREVEIDISEPLAVVSMEVDGRSPVTMEDKGPQDRCARALSLEEYRARFTEKKQIGVATLVGDSPRILTPVIPAIDPDTRRVVMSAEGDIRKVVLTENTAGPSRSPGLGETVSQREERSGHKKKTKKYKGRKRGVSISGAALQAVLSSPRVRLVDCLTMARDAPWGHSSSKPLVGPGNSELPDDHMSWKMARSTSAERSSDGRLSPLPSGNHPAASAFPVAVESSDERGTSTSSESCMSPVPVLGHGKPVASVNRGPSCICRCHVRNGSCCPCRCSCSHRDVACQTDWVPPGHIDME